MSAGYWDGQTGVLPVVAVVSTTDEHAHGRNVSVPAPVVAVVSATAEHAYGRNVLVPAAGLRRHDSWAERVVRRCYLI